MRLQHALIAVLVIVAGVVIAETYYATLGRDHGPSSRLREEVTRTQRSARNLDDSYSEIMPPPPPRLASPARNGDAEPQPATPAEGQEPPPPMTYTDQPAGGAPPEPAAPEKPYETNDNPADGLARDGVSFSRGARQELEASDTEYTSALEAFYDEWNQRYTEAAAEHRRFRWRLEQADRIAAIYFQKQAELTELMPNRERKAYYQARDQEEREMFLEWQLQAHDILAQSGAIMRELRQLNLEITKQTMSADFASLYREFHQIPMAITTLHGELDLFRQRSEQLENQFSRG